MRLDFSMRSMSVTVIWPPAAPTPIMAKFFSSSQPMAPAPGNHAVYEKILTGTHIQVEFCRSSVTCAASHTCQSTHISGVVIKINNFYWDRSKTLLYSINIIKLLDFYHTTRSYKTHSTLTSIPFTDNSHMKHQYYRVHVCGQVSVKNTRVYLNQTLNL